MRNACSFGGSFDFGPGNIMHRWKESGRAFAQDDIVPLAGFDEAYEGCEEGCVGDGDVVFCGGSDYGSVDGIDFCAAVGVDVLQHGGLMAGVGFEGFEDHVLGALEVGGDAAGVGDGDNFGDDGEGGSGAGGD
jgi:hypothetical protein